MTKSDHTVTTLEEYYHTMQAIHAEYGAVYEIVDEEKEDFEQKKFDVIDAEYAEGMFSETRAALEANDKRNLGAQALMKAIETGDITYLYQLGPDSLMPYTYTGTHNNHVKLGTFGSVNILTRLVAKADAQYGQFTSVTSATIAVSRRRINMHFFDLA